MLCDTPALKQQACDNLWMAYQPPTPFEAVGGPTVIVQAAGCVMFDLGLITLTLHPGNVIFFSPPLIISREDVEQRVGIVDRALARDEDTN